MLNKRMRYNKTLSKIYIFWIVIGLSLQSRVKIKFSLLKNVEKWPTYIKEVLSFID